MVIVILKRTELVFGYILGHQHMDRIRQCQMLCRNIAIGVYNNNLFLKEYAVIKMGSKMESYMFKVVPVIGT